MPGRNGRLLLLGAVCDERRAEQPVADHADAAGPAGADVLVPEDQLPAQREVEPADGLRPRHAHEPGAAELLLPRDAGVDGFVLTPGRTLAAHLGEVAVEARRQPLADLGGERPVLGGVLEVHPLRAGALGLGERLVRLGLLPEVGAPGDRAAGRTDHDVLHLDVAMRATPARAARR